MSTETWVLPCLYVLMIFTLFFTIFEHFRNVKNRGSLDWVVPHHHHWLTSHAQVSPIHLMVFRLVVFVFVLTVWVIDIAGGKGDGLKYYTVWNFTVLTFYFGLASYNSFAAFRAGFTTATHESAPHHTVNTEAKGSDSNNPNSDHSVNLSGKHQDDSAEDQISATIREDLSLFSSNSGRVSSLIPLPHLSPRLATLQMLILEIELPTALLLDTVTWTVLLPSAEDNGSEDDYLCFTSYVMHASNIVLLVTELLLNRVPFRRHHYYAVMPWPIIYSFAEQIFHSMTNEWQYDFMSTGDPSALLWYPGLLAAHLFFFGIAYLLATRVKAWLCGPEFSAEADERRWNEVGSGGDGDGPQAPLLHHHRHTDLLRQGMDEEEDEEQDSTDERVLGMYV